MKVSCREGNQTQLLWMSGNSVDSVERVFSGALLGLLWAEQIKGLRNEHLYERVIECIVMFENGTVKMGGEIRTKFYNFALHFKQNNFSSGCF